MISVSRADVELRSDHAFGNLGRALDVLETDRRLIDEETYSDSNPRQVAITRTYLWLLGYLKHNNGRSEPDKELEQGLLTFRDELGVGAAARLDQQTWDTLRRYACFSPGSTSAAVEIGMLPAAVLTRVLHLRLFSYGLMSHKPAPGDQLNVVQYEKDLDKALIKFAQLACYLGLADYALEPSRANSALVALLLNHDQVLTRLQCTEQEIFVFTGHPNHPLNDVSAKKLRASFIKKLAEVELWLLGYMVRPGNFAIDGFESEGRTDSLSQGLTKLARDRSIKMPDKEAIRVGGWFFQEAKRAMNQGFERAVVPDERVDTLLRDKKQRGDLEKRYKSLGARLIDGLKRALSATVSFFKRLFTGAKKILTSLSRMVHAKALAVYRRLRAMVEVTRLGFSYFFTASLADSDNNAIHISKGRDFDMVLVVDPLATRSELTQTFDTINLHVRAMEIGGSVIGKLWELINAAISMSRGAIGWLGLLLNLVKLGNWLRETKGLAQESVELLRKLEAMAA